MIDSCEHGSPCCFKCKLRTITVSPAAMPSRRNTVAPRGGGNDWERGIATNGRGMPLLDPDTGAEMSVKTFGEKRHRVDEARRRRHYETATTSASKGT